MTRADIAIAGLGRMGQAMTLRLLDQGLRVAVWNRSAKPREAMRRAGAQVTDSLPDLVRTSEHIITVLHDDSAVRAVYLGDDGLLAGEVAGRLFIEMSTVQPQTIRELHARVRAGGASMLEAPVSGTVQPARQGQLVALIGGNTEDVARARPILELLARKIVHAGGPGQGSLLKLVVNLPLGVYWHALGEALALGAAGGLSRRFMLQTIADSSAALSVLPLKLPAILGDSDEVAFDVDSMCKDLRIMAHVAAELGVPANSVTSALASYTELSEAGFGGDDAVTVARPIPGMDGDQSYDPE